jgi:hypothetical protein
VVRLPRVGVAVALLSLSVTVTGCNRRAAEPASGPSVNTAPANTAPADVHLTVREIVRLAAKSVVVVRTPYGLGTGFIVEPGLVATNLHVIAGADRMAIAGHDGKPRLVSAVVAVDPEHDLALVAFDADPLDLAKLPSLPLGHGKDLVSGDPVVALGTPEGLELSASTGIVSAVREVTPTITLVQTTAPISPGSSGGPLIDDGGRVVAVTTLFAKNGQNLNFAVPVEYVSEMMEHRDAPLSPAEFAKLRFSRDAGPRRKRAAPWQAPSPRSSRPFPRAVGGFRLGSRLEDARAACPSKWTEGNSRAKCATTAEEIPFAPGPVELFFLRNRLVSVSVAVGSLGEAAKALTAKYGAASKEGHQLSWKLEGGEIVLGADRAPASRTPASTKTTAYVLYTANTWDENSTY